jgi:hypothetical protein
MQRREVLLPFRGTCGYTLVSDNAGGLPANVFFNAVLSFNSFFRSVNACHQKPCRSDKKYINRLLPDSIYHTCKNDMCRSITHGTR